MASLLNPTLTKKEQERAKNLFARTLGSAAPPAAAEEPFDFHCPSGGETKYARRFPGRKAPRVWTEYTSVQKAMDTMKTSPPDSPLREPVLVYSKTNGIFYLIDPISRSVAEALVLEGCPVDKQYTADICRWAREQGLFYPGDTLDICRQ